MDGRTLRIQTADDGSGFDPEQIVVADGHLGLVTMRERAEMAGGTLSIETRNGRGSAFGSWSRFRPGGNGWPEVLAP